MPTDMQTGVKYEYFVVTQTTAAGLQGRLNALAAEGYRLEHYVSPAANYFAALLIRRK